MKKLSVLIPEENEPRSAFVRRIRKTEGELLIIFPALDYKWFSEKGDRETFLETITKLSGRVRLASRNNEMVVAARRKGIRVIDQVKDLKSLMADHIMLDEALRVFSPHIWRQQLRSKLQAMGLLTLPKIRIWVLIVMSIALFYFVLFRLLPSAEVEVVPREDTLSQTANIFLVLSGALVEMPDRVRTVELKPIFVEVNRIITFDQISKEFIGASASVDMTIVNESDESFGLRSGTRVKNQAGMIFRLQLPVQVDPGEEKTVPAVADDEDIYGEIIGARGNVPIGIKWELIGLLPEEQKFVYGINKEAATGGKTNYRTVLKEHDLDIAQKQLEKELLTDANQIVDEEILLYNATNPEKVLTRLYYDELTKITFSGFVMPLQFIGEQVASVPLEGTVIYNAFAYDAQYILTLLESELKAHTKDGKKLLPESVQLERLVSHVIDYEDDLSWIKLTVDLSGTEQFVLDPLTPTGARFGKTVREMIIGKTKEEAQRIVQNFPEVEKADISIWPPWHNVMPTIPYHISIEVTEL